MAFIHGKRGLNELRRSVRGSGFRLRDYAGRTQFYEDAEQSGGDMPQQLAARRLLKKASADWKALSDAARSAWKDYAARYGGHFGDQEYKNVSGWDVYLLAHRNRALSALPPAAAPQDIAPPAAIREVEEVASADPRTFTFRIDHTLFVQTSSAPGTGAPPGNGESENAVMPIYWVLCRITPATVSVGRKPNIKDLRLICAHSPTSLVPLPRSGESITFENAQYAVAPDERYGLELRIVRIKDGIHGPAVYRDCYRK